MLRRAHTTMISTLANPTPKIPIPARGVDYRNKIVLAPMVRSGELPMRLTYLEYGADLVWGPETVDRALVGTQTRFNPKARTIEYTRIPSNQVKTPTEAQKIKESVIYRICPSLESERLVFQIGTASPELAVRAAQTVAPYVAGIDVNAGCPKPFSTSGGMGAALLSTPDLLCDILTKLVEEVGRKYEIGISVKIRLLSTEEETKALVEQLCKTGITGLTIHCRTKAMRKNEPAIRTQLRMIGDACRAAGVACLMNGDVETREDAERLVAEYGVDGAMMATAAEKNPSVFRPKEHGGPAPWRELVGGYLETAIDVENRWGNTKFSLAQMVPGKEQNARGISQARNYEDVCRRLEMGHLLDKAKELDEALGLVERETKAETKARARVKREEEDADRKAERKRQKLDAQQIKLSKRDTQGDYLTDLQHDIIAPVLKV